MDIGLLVDPATFATDRAFDGERPRRARIAERDHRLIEARSEPLDRAVTDAGRGHLDLRAVVTHRERGAQRRGDQRQNTEPGNELHGTNPPKGRRTLAGQGKQANGEMTASETDGNLESPGQVNLII